MNAVEIESAISDLALEPFDAAEFPFSFMAAFGRKDAEIKRLRAGNNNASDVPGGVLLRNNIHIAACEPGTVGETLKALRTSSATTKAKAKFILATDGQTLEAEELITGETITCDYPDFPNHFGFLLPLAGISTIKEIKDNPIDVRATSRLNKLYVELLNENPDWAKAERRADMNHFMARLVFCFFAEDTDIFRGESLFTRTMERYSERDGSNTHQVLSEIFRAMNIKDAERTITQPRLPGWANSFPYVNGGLFSGSTEVPRFTRMARTYLLHAGNLNWKKINPDIFGSMIQAVADDEERGALGMHYTSVPNILKVLNPLFLDDLRAQLEAAGDNKAKLLNLRKRLAHIRVFDPACGSGNFLVIAYKQMREIEAEINRRRGEAHNKSEIPLTNFRGIELRDFPAEIARLALIIAEFQCDVLYRGQQDALAEFLPLDTQNWIVCGNALRLDWLSICPPTGTGVKVVADDLFGTPLNQTEIDFANEGGETYICGNPPYLGSQWRDEAQQSDMDAVFSKETKSYKDLDYVAAWYLKAAQYCAEQDADFALVATKTICQGIQVAMLWPLILDRGLSIFFAHRPFTWGNLAKDKAGVTCVIVGVSKRRRQFQRLFDGDTLKEVSNIGPYLIGMPNVIVEKRPRRPDDLPTMDYGNKPSDGGNLIFEGKEEIQNILQEYPEASPLIRRYMGSQEFVRSTARHCLWIESETLQLAELIPPIKMRFDLVRKVRSASKGKQSNDNANTPHRFVYTPHKDGVALIVPRVTSENRPYLPCGFVDGGTVVADTAAVIYEAPIWCLALVASRLHQQWIATVCVRLRTDYRYSNTLGWNTFPVPLLTEQNKADLTRCAEDILLAREAHFPATIADLYDPEAMPDNLRHAHERNDEVLERIYIGRRFRNDTERLEKLFDLYTKMTADTSKVAPKKPRGKKA
ncbi:TPA: class I SAM-dependent DNA methyltransferase [Pseudomonas aeruginosa]|uniref:site-specific DNA-methyltransferase (adenine-specific) n=1 Tax=Pseudomonas mangrovi TaxID=2161748 RepID=A0A2T5PD50_9PSED|nr:MULTISPECIES: DNA methyltransferase [Pseudomonas]KYO87721.1 N-6 DNA Methylase [Pseudomonas aeruginosa]PTU75653.1 class I SAM-dependent DNA methyltransferase [Pseudomonas mangrovi]HBN8607643.1 class I SAM-dependent DNA methyltransferase [Pseudomonas aeruginosa]HEJ1325420.1 class I SAM-dependent DNA methyltransferase [Pseudomonas aeruginosa]